MHLKKAEWCEPWMTNNEKRIMKRQMAAMRKIFINGGVPESPFISMRAIDIGIHYLMVRRLEQALAVTFAPHETTTAKTENDSAPAMPVPAFALPQLVEQIGRTRERLRKSIRELEEACAKLGKPVEIGIADKLLPFVREARHLIQNGIVDEDISDSESPHVNDEPLDDTAGNGHIPVPDSPSEAHNIPDDTAGNGHIPVPDSPTNTPDIPDTPDRKANIPVHPPLLTFPNADSKNTAYSIFY